MPITIFNINEVNGVLVSLLLTVNIFQTSFKLLSLTRETLVWFILKRLSLLKTASGILCVCCNILSVNKICQQIAFELIPSKQYKWISEKFFAFTIFAKKLYRTNSKYMLYNFFLLSLLTTRSKYKNQYPLDTRHIFRTQPNIYDGDFCQNSSQLKAVNCFQKDPYRRFSAGF